VSSLSKFSSATGTTRHCTAACPLHWSVGQRVSVRLRGQRLFVYVNLCGDRKSILTTATNSDWVWCWARQLRQGQQKRLATACYNAAATHTHTHTHIDLTPRPCIKNNKCLSFHPSTRLVYLCTALHSSRPSGPSAFTLRTDQCSDHTDHQRLYFVAYVLHLRWSSFTLVRFKRRFYTYSVGECCVLIEVLRGLGGIFAVFLRFLAVVERQKFVAWTAYKCESDITLETRLQLLRVSAPKSCEQLVYTELTGNRTCTQMRPN